MDMNKGQCIKPGICHGSSEKCLILFMELKDLPAVAVVTGSVKRTVRMKEMFGFNSASKASSVIVNVLGRYCSPEQQAFKRLHA